jgi:hypothetical protein
MNGADHADRWWHAANAVTARIHSQIVLGHAMACPAVLNGLMSLVDSNHELAFDRHGSPPQSRRDKGLKRIEDAALIER